MGSIYCHNEKDPRDVHVNPLMSSMNIRQGSVPTFSWTTELVLLDYGEMFHQSSDATLKFFQTYAAS